DILARWRAGSRRASGGDRTRVCCEPPRRQVPVHLGRSVSRTCGSGRQILAESASSGRAEARCPPRESLSRWRALGRLEFRTNRVLERATGWHGIVRGRFPKVKPCKQFREPARI